MKFLKNSAIITAYVLLIGVFFTVGYAWGNKNVKTKTAAGENQTMEVSQIKSDVEETNYLLIIENSQICIYKTDGGQRQLIQSDHITEGIFPSVDIKQLREGIRVNSYEEAQQIFENFVS